MDNNFTYLQQGEFTFKTIQIRAVLVFLLFISAKSVFGCANQFDFVVATDGSGDFIKVQDAINAVPDFRKKCTTIFIKNGVYKEKLVLPASKNNVSFIGEDNKKTIITYDDYASKKNSFGEEMGTTGSSGFFVFGNDFTARNITFKNSAGPVGQAVAVRIDGDRVIFDNCRFLGNQDTLYPHGKGSRQYYKNCYIEGTVDFIFGWSIAVFDNCEIFCKEKGYVTAASTIEEQEYGFVFLDCKILGDGSEESFYLGRPWRPYAKTVFINCYLDKHIKPEGWHNWGSEEKEKTAFYAEYSSIGPGSNTNNRVEWSHQLSEMDMEKYSLDNILKGADNWNYLSQLEDVK
ncbi:pectinesterase family protein [Carboxylicivirga linearis]|uniref:Pectinesterase n=1 Tax=Carboxylicivirga linearis TaxID=1628157 RepID=A0ABS5JZ61_9BACT|nr:pectinesterase family protein [Carboxylicivirga linearis]MBS2099691.1 pectin esterase [Carboxylicivirga linearis]